jgi:nicotinamide-nucleotide amidase
MDSTSEQRIGRKLAEHGFTLSTAESCTGGLIAHRITNVPGSSEYFHGGVVAYANSAKEGLLGVPKTVLDSHGAVSEAVARAMAEGVRTQFGASHGIGTTGIAGPGGGTPEKPVGLVYIAVSGPGETKVHQLMLEGDRGQIKSLTAEAALHYLEGLLA